MTENSEQKGGTAWFSLEMLVPITFFGTENPHPDLYVEAAQMMIERLQSAMNNQKDLEALLLMEVD